MRSYSFQLSAFTLIELIVVVSILSILGTVGFISIEGYSLRSRDTVRMSHFSLISKALEVQKDKGTLLPMPDSKVTITASSTPILYQGLMTNSVLGIIGISSGVQDPRDGIPYTYSVNSTQTRWQILGFYEGPGLVESSYGGFSQAYANGLDYSNRYAATRGDSLGILLSTGSKSPIQVSGIDVDVDTTTSDYQAVLSNSSEFTGTGNVLYQINSKASCKRILESGLSKGDGIYHVTVRGVSLQVYCDMSTDDGGWTLVLSGGNGVVINAGNTGSVNTDLLLTKKPGGKLSDEIINNLYRSQFRTTSSHSMFQDKKLYARLVSGKKWDYTLDWYQSEHIKTSLIYDKSANYTNSQGLFQVITNPTYFAFNHWGDMDVWFSYANIARYFEAPCCVVNPTIYLWVR